MTYISVRQFEQISLDSLFSTNIPSLKGESRLKVHDEHANLCVCSRVVVYSRLFQLVN